MKFYRDRSEIDLDKYLIATYKITSSTSLDDAAWNLAIGQSVGNPNVRNEWETDDLFENHSCIILGDKYDLQHRVWGNVEIAFPVANTDWETDGINHLICQLMGGHVDIDCVTSCRLIKLELPEVIWSTDSQEHSRMDYQKSKVNFSVATQNYTFDPVLKSTGSY